MTTADRQALHDLLVDYFRGFDERRDDPVALARTFTDDAVVRFPAGSATGLEEIAVLTQHLLRLWGPTLHGVSSIAVVDDDEDEDHADLCATLHATHLHRDDDPGDALHIGARVSARAGPVGSGWRLRSLTLELIWSHGDAPGTPDD
jgi:SnoaL-like protein